MKGNPKRPPWSQPLCQKCYVKKFGSECTVKSTWEANEFCYTCGEVTGDGIYLDIRPHSKRPKGNGAHDKEIKEWVKLHGEYLGGAIPGSADEAFLP